MKNAIKRLKTLDNLFQKYKHRYGENASPRMLSWIDEYNDIRANQYHAFEQYCEEMGYDKSHNALDCLA